jgi:hypothetical protein
MLNAALRPPLIDNAPEKHSDADYLPKLGA